jgi:D-alanine transaminase
MQLAMINERILPFEQLDPVYHDRGIYFGDGVYEVIRSYNGKIFALEDHLERFERGLAAIDIAGVEVDTVRKRVENAFSKSQIADAKIYFHVTRGSAPRTHAGTAGLKPNFFLTITALEDKKREKERGIAVSTYPDLRWKRCDIKTLNLLPNVLAERDAEKKGCTEAILVNEDGLITEGAASAFFAVFDFGLWTTPLGANVLASVTRKWVLRAAEGVGLEVIEESVEAAQADKADELFIGVTTRDIVGIVEFDGKTVGSGRPGEWTRKLEAEFLKFTV